MAETAKRTTATKKTLKHVEQDASWDIPLETLKWKIQTVKKDKTKALYVPYPDARIVAAKLDEIFGWDGWEDAYEYWDTNSVPGAAVMCTLTIHDANGKSIAKQSLGVITDIEPWKGAESDAFKRAAAKLGIGRNVYDINPIWAPVEEHAGKVYPPRGIETRLAKEAKAALQGRHAAQPVDVPEPAPQEAKPENEVPQDKWDEYVAMAKKVPEDSKPIIREWWSMHGDGRSRPMRDMALDVFNALVERTGLEILGAEEVPTDEEPF